MQYYALQDTKSKKLLKINTNKVIALNHKGFNITFLTTNKHFLEKPIIGYTLHKSINIKDLVLVKSINSYSKNDFINELLENHICKDILRRFCIINSIKLNEFVNKIFKKLFIDNSDYLISTLKYITNNSKLVRFNNNYNKSLLLNIVNQKLIFDNSFYIKHKKDYKTIIEKIFL